MQKAEYPAPNSIIVFPLKINIKKKYIYTNNHQNYLKLHKQLPIHYFISL